MDKNNVVPNPLSQKEEYQGEMPLGTTQIFNAMLVGKNNLEHKIKEGYVKDHFVQHYFVELDNKKTVEGITFLDGLLKWKKLCIYVHKGKLHIRANKKYMTCQWQDNVMKKSQERLKIKTFTNLKW